MYSIMPLNDGDSTKRNDSALSRRHSKSRSLKPSSVRRDILSLGAKKLDLARAVDVGDDGGTELRCGIDEC